VSRIEHAGQSSHDGWQMKLPLEAELPLGRGNPTGVHLCCDSTVIYTCVSSKEGLRGCDGGSQPRVWLDSHFALESHFSESEFCSVFKI